MISEAQQKKHLDWLVQLTAIPTAAGREQRVIEWVEKWTKARRNLSLKRDKAGNLFITRTGPKPRGGGSPRPLLITAHLDHPAFVVREMAGDRTVVLEFRGGVDDPYFENARIEIYDRKGKPHVGVIAELDAKATPFKQAIVHLTGPAKLERGDVGRWRFDDHHSLPKIDGGILHTHACDDLAAVAAALATLDVVRNRKGFEHVGLLLTRAEEVGFTGALAACKDKSIPKGARLICLENSRSFVDSPIGAGPILRVGDRISVFEPKLTNRLTDIFLDYEKKHEFRWQRKLMPGGACEATGFSSFGYESTCICLPLGNYHNMQDIDGVRAGRRPAKVGPEYIAVSDYHGMIEMLVLAAEQLDTADIEPLRKRMENRLKATAHVLEG
jgi:putative aminopeptidase FrvX